MSFVRDTPARPGAADKPTWVTEAGYPGDPREQTGRQFQGAQGQADWRRDRLPDLLELGAKRVFWFKLLDTDADAGAGSYGLLDRDATPKPAYEADREPHRRPAGACHPSTPAKRERRHERERRIEAPICPHRAVPTGGEVVSRRPRRGRCSPHRPT
jgi:hypothetical protein